MASDTVAASAPDSGSKYDVTLAELMDWRECARCRISYQEIDNMGTWPCRYHVGYPQITQVDPFCSEAFAGLNVYTCCGVSAHPQHPRYVDALAAAGCVRCDHIFGGVPFGSKYSRREEEDMRRDEAEQRAVDPRCGASLAHEMLLTIEEARVLLGEERIVRGRGVTLERSTNMIRIRRAAPHGAAKPAF